MKVAVFSDTHDHWPNIKKACRIAKKKNALLLVHCGDVCAPITLRQLAESWQGEIHYCFGNVDGDRFLMVTKTKDLPKIHHHGEVLGELNLADRRIAFQHYPELARALACSGKYDAVFYGHDHLKHTEFIKQADGRDVLLANPGNLCGIKAPPSFGIYDTQTNSIKIYDL